MINEEAISYLESIPKYIDYNNESYYAVSWEILEAIQQAIEALKAQQWIPCSQRLPEKDDGYLCTLDDGSMMLVSYSDGYFRVMNPNVIAWMPLPESYKEETK